MKPRPERVYHYHGLVERMHRNKTLEFYWRAGYSESSERGAITYPWATRAECRREAKQDNMKAVFYRDGKREA